jgi:hypothetical protein
MWNHRVPQPCRTYAYRLAACQPWYCGTTGAFLQTEGLTDATQVILYPDPDPDPDPGPGPDPDEPEPEFEPQTHTPTLAQVLLYLAVAKLDEPPIDGITDTNPEGLTAAKGKWGATFAARLQGGGLKCRLLEGDAYTKAMLEKHVCIC